MAKYAATERTMKAAPLAVRVLHKSFQRHLQAENKAPRAVQSYTESLNRFAAFLQVQGMPTDPADVSREHVESFIADLLSTHKPATASNRYRALQTFYRRQVDEGEIAGSPMAKMKLPAVPEPPPEVLTEAQINRLLRECDGKTFEDRRDTAFIRLLLATGMRRAELADLKLDDLDLDLDQNWPSCSARDDGRAPARSARRRPWRSIAICRCAPSIATPIVRSFGWAMSGR